MGAALTYSPASILICCEGTNTEPQYFNIVKKQFRIGEKARVKVIGKGKQHKILVDLTVAERAKLCKSEHLEAVDIEAWAVCDKDNMPYSLTELEEYAQKSDVKLAFSDPQFEIFLLQHFLASSTSLSGKHLENLLSNKLRSKGVSAGYIKEDIRCFESLLDQEPGLVRTAMKNCATLQDKKDSPYTTTHLLLARLLEFEP